MEQILELIRSKLRFLVVLVGTRVPKEGPYLLNHGK